MSSRLKTYPHGRIGRGDSGLLWRVLWWVCVWCIRLRMEGRSCSMRRGLLGAECVGVGDDMGGNDDDSMVGWFIRWWNSLSRSSSVAARVWWMDWGVSSAPSPFPFSR